MTFIPFSQSELKSMQATQTASMMDSCQILVYAPGEADVYGMPAQSWLPGDTVPCGYNPNPKPEAMGNTEVVMRDAKVRLPIETQLDNRSRIQITHRFGVVLPQPILYEIIGEARRGPSGLVLNLKLLTTGEGKENV